MEDGREGEGEGAKKGIEEGRKVIRGEKKDGGKE